MRLGIGRAVEIFLHCKIMKKENPMKKSKAVSTVNMDQSSEPALVDGDDEIFGLCPDHHKQESFEDPNYGKKEHSTETRDASTKEFNEQVGNDNVGDHIDKSNQRVTPTLRRSNRIKKPMVRFCETSIVTVAEPLTYEDSIYGRVKDR